MSPVGNVVSLRTRFDLLPAHLLRASPSRPRDQRGILNAPVAKALGRAFDTATSACRCFALVASAAAPWPLPLLVRAFGLLYDVRARAHIAIFLT